MGVREAICVPMQGRYDVVGAIYIDTSTSAQQVIQQGAANKFTEDHLKLMIAIGHQAALAVEDTRYYSAMVQAERLAAIGQTIATLSHHIKNILQGIRGGSYLIEMGLTDHDDDVVPQGLEDRRDGTRTASRPWSWTCSPSARSASRIWRAANINGVVSDVIELIAVRAAEDAGRAASGSPRRADARHGVRSRGHAPRGAERGHQRRRRGDASAERPAAGWRSASHVPRRRRRWCGSRSTDNGPGIPADQMEHLFSPFVSSKKSRGTGLGLPVSQKILAEHGGRILVDSEPGRGAASRWSCPQCWPRPAMRR